MPLYFSRCSGVRFSSSTAPWRRMFSSICAPTGMTGFSAVEGSWKIMPISLPRISSISAFDSFMRSRPLKMISPLLMTPGG